MDTRPRLVPRFPLWAVLILLSVGTSLSRADQFTGILLAPDAVDRAQLRVGLLDEPPGRAENDPRFQHNILVSAGGEFSPECTTPTTRTVLEVTGKGIRRARFPWPFSVLQVKGRRPSFRLDAGGSTELAVVDAATKTPLPGALIGPVVPTEDIGREEMDKTYPFYVESGPDGKASISGLLPNQSYYANVFAEGHIRRKVTISPNTPLEVALQPGGLSLSGTVKGEKTGRVYPGQIVLLMGGPEDFYIERRTDDQGRFAFTGLPEGTYKLMAQIENLGGAPPTEYSVFGAKSLEGIFLMVSEGITISGVVADLETGQPIADADIFLRSRIGTTDNFGRFEFLLVQGPWPIEPTVRHPDYEFDRDAQDPAMYPVNGFNMNDILDLTLKMRKKRFLVVHNDNNPTPEITSMLEMHGPLEERNVGLNRQRADGARAVLPLRSAGTRLCILRSSAGLISAMVPAETALDATTTTIHVSLGPSARVEGSLTYDDGPPAPSFSVIIETDLGGKLPRKVELISTSPNSQGAFALGGLPPGEVTVRLVRPEGEPYVEEKVTLVRGQTVTLTRQIRRGLVLAGHVVDQEGKPLKMIPLSVYGEDPAGDSLHLNSVSDEDGSFRIEGFGGKTVRELRAAYHGYAPLSMKDIPIPNENLEVVLTNRNGIEVQVNGPPSNLVLSSVMILVGRQRSVESAPPQWFYEVESKTPLSGETTVNVFPAATGRLRLAVEAQDGQWDVSPAFEWTPEVSGRSMQLTPGHESSLTVSVKGVTEEELAALDVTLLNTALPESSSTPDFTPTRGGARLVFDRIPAGEYLLLATASSGQYASRSNIDIATGQSAEVSLDFAKASISITGKVVAGGETKKPVSGAKVILRYGDVPEADVLLESTTAVDGSFRFDEVPSQRPYLLEATHEARSRQTTLSGDAAAADAQVEIVLEPEIPVTFTASEALWTRWAKNPNVPLLIQELNGSKSAMVRSTEMKNPVSLTPGEYRVSLGEDPLGTVEVPASTEPVEISLPEGTPQP